MSRRERRVRRRNLWIAVAGIAVVAVAAAVAWIATNGSSDDASGAAVRAQRRAASPTTTSTSVTSSTTTTSPAPAPTTAATAPPPPAPAGPPYAVGVARFTLIDPTRPTAALDGDPATPDRTLPVTLRYPSTGAVGSESDGPPAAGGTFPLVVFAHGYDISAAAYDAFTRDLAADGFVVAAPDFPLSSTSPPGPVTEADIDNQARDVSFLIGNLSAGGAGLPPAVVGHVAATEAGVVGHSDGGSTVARTAANSCCFDGRVGAAVILSGDEATLGGNFGVPGSPPMLLLQGTADDINPWSLSQRLYDDLAGPKWLVAIDGAGHLAPYTSGPQRVTIVRLVADFLHVWLQDSTRLQQAVDDANRDGLSLVASA